MKFVEFIINSHLHLQTSYLYSTFAGQVEFFCKSSTIKNCSFELLKYGLNKLKNTPEETLDIMDPYQRDADKISEYLKSIEKLRTNQIDQS